MTDDVSTPSQALIVRPSVLPSTAQFGIMRDLALRLASARGFLPDHYFTGNGEERFAKVLAAIEYGRAVGIEPMIALQNLTFIDGKIGASAQLIGAQLRRAGYRIATSWYDAQGVAVPKESPNVHGCKIILSKGGEVTGDGVFSLTDAQRAGLIRDKSGWQRYPKDMLYARALTQAAREGAQDAALGMAYTAEELGVVEDYDTVTPSSVIDGEVVSSGAPEATGSLPVAAIQPAPPAVPSQGAQVTESPSQSEQTSPAPPAPFAAAPLSGPSVSRRMGRSIGPAPKRTNVIEVPQAAETPTTAPEVPPSTQVSAEVVSSQPAPSALTDEPVAADAIDEGQRIYLDSQRTELRLQAATLARLNAIVKNHLVHPLKGEDLEEVPPASPTPASDEALRYLIERDYPGRTLETLGEAELQNRLELIQPFIDKRRAQLKEKGITEE